MIAGSVSLDSSVLLRLLVGKPQEQYEQAFRFIKEQLSNSGSVQVCDLVLAEVYFALHGYYKLPKKEALQAILLFAKHSGVNLSPVAVSVLSQPDLASSKPGFVDRLIHGGSVEAGHTLVSFEKAAKKLPATFVLG